ncbi:MAG TPA: hypothetical protein VGM90_36640 [Kofleriaceae bacterium]|jgi:hypothetical protein
MRLAAFALLALVGCGNGVGDDAPIYGGGGGSGGGGTGGDDTPQIDSGTGDAGTSVNGKVCIVADARFLTTSCKVTEVDGLLVTLAGSTARTLGDGSFTIAEAGDSSTLWHVTSDSMSNSNADVVPSIQQVSLSTILSTFSKTAYTNLLTNNGVDQVDTTGGLFLRTTHNNAPQSGVSALTTQSMYVFYDNDQSGTQWQTSAQTATNGVIWIPNALPDQNGNVAITLTPPSGPDVHTDVKVLPGNITFATVAFP